MAQQKATFIIPIIALAAVLAAAFMVPTGNMVSQEMSNEVLFEDWISEHKKSYNTPAEKLYRLSVFGKNLNNIWTHNASESTYKLGLNKFSDLTEEEFEAKYLGYRFSDKPKNYELTFENSVSQTPAAVDWRTQGIVAPVKNQGQCGSCWAFSAVAAIEGAIAQSKGSITTFAEQQLVDCSFWYGNHGCNGGLMDHAFNYVKKKGLTTEANYPYTAKDGKCDKTAVAKKVATISGHKDVKKNHQTSLKEASAGRVVSVAIQANAIMSYKGGVFKNGGCGTALNHGVAVVGYGTDAAAGEDFWIVRNSWGADWGEAGYIRIYRDDKTGPGMCGIAMQPSYPTV